MPMMPIPGPPEKPNPWDKWARGCSELEFVQIARVELELGKAYCDPVFTIAGLSIILSEANALRLPT
jgi:hypothetical protein